MRKPTDHPMTYIMPCRMPAIETVYSREELTAPSPMLQQAVPHPRRANLESDARGNASLPEI